MSLATFREYSRKLLGVPYEKKDCWGICKEFYSLVFKVEILAWFDYINLNQDVGGREWALKSNNLIEEVKKFFVPTDSPEFGDLVLLKIYGIPAHVAIYLDSKNILHTDKKNGSHIDRLFRWEGSIEGYFRYVEI